MIEITKLYETESGEIGTYVISLEQFADNENASQESFERFIEKNNIDDDY
jgi:hypothetical protein